MKQQGPSSISTDRSVKLLQAIKSEDLKTFADTLSVATPDEVLVFFYLPYIVYAYSR